MDTSRFEKWSEEKIQISKRETPSFYIKKREIWFVKIGQNIGNEENGKTHFNRPVLVIKKVGNLYFAIAITTKGKSNSIFYHQLIQFHLHPKFRKYHDTSFAILSQARVLDKKRFERKIGIVTKQEFLNIKQKLKALLL